ncbi:MAG: hypothetical protein JNN15_02345 [Blastocatellia bacterium]|nr:hypothetical protein [Blastocatellia bacterium]
MKKCPFCKQKLQENAHYCQFCNSTIVDLDGNPILVQEFTNRQKTILEKLIQLLVAVFFSVQFFLFGLMLLSSIFGNEVIKLSSTTSILLNIVLAVISIGGAILITNPVINLVKSQIEKLDR